MNDPRNIGKQNVGAEETYCSSSGLLYVRLRSNPTWMSCKWGANMRGGAGMILTQGTGHFEDVWEEMQRAERKFKHVASDAEEVLPTRPWGGGHRSARVCTGCVLGTSIAITLTCS